jgi:hypothetical protein
VDGRTTAPVPVGLGLTAGHLLAVAAAAVVVVVATLGLGSGWFRSLAPASPPAHVPAAAAAVPGTSVVTVRPGDSLWSIARRLQPGGDVRPLVDRLVELNGSAPLQPGDRVVVPG